MRFRKNVGWRFEPKSFLRKNAWGETRRRVAGKLLLWQSREERAGGEEGK